MKWLNALGMLLQFISFWLAAPEIIGDNGLKRMQDMLKKLVSNLSIILLTAIIAGYALFFGINGIMKGLEGTANGISKEELIRYYITLFIAGIVYAVFMVKFRKIKLWIDLHVSAPLIEKYIHSDRLRKNSLISGALLFTFGFLIQFVIILLQP